MSTKTKNTEISTDAVQSILDSINEIKRFNLHLSNNLTKEIQREVQSVRQELAELTHEFSSAFEFYQDQIGNQALARWIEERREAEKAAEELKLRSESIRMMAVEITKKYSEQIKNQFDHMNVIRELTAQQLLHATSAMAN
jgi:hypothetical protein